MAPDPFRDPQPDLLTCRACARDVSVPPGAEDPRCPRCGGELGAPRDPGGDAQEHTLLEAGRQVPASGGGFTQDSQPALFTRPPQGLGGEETEPTLLDAPISDTATSPEAAPAPAEPALKELGPYQLRGVLGKGGMGVVYEAFQPALGRTVALKVMSGEEAGEEELVRFEREARAAARLHHPNIVPIFETGQVEGRRYFTMDMVRGRTLQALARAGELTPERAAQLVARVAHAIQHAHEQGVIHRDLKPSNVLVEEASGEPKVTDFGLAKDLSDQVQGLTLTGVAMGSPPYMPPEQARGDFRLVDEVSDVYGLGAVLYEALTGTPPFGGKSLYDVIAKVLVEEPVAPRRKNPTVPYDLETICLKALEKEKWRRYQSAREMARDLERFLEGHTIRAARHGLTTRIGRGIARHRHPLLAAGIPTVVVAALLAIRFGPGAAAPQPPREPPGSPSTWLDRAADDLPGGFTPALLDVIQACAASGRPPGSGAARQAIHGRLRGTAREAALRAFSRPDDQPVSPEEVASAARALLALRQDVPEPEQLVELCLAWTRPTGEELPALLRRVARLAALDARRAPEGEMFASLEASIREGPPVWLDQALLGALPRAGGLEPRAVAALGIDPAALERLTPLLPAPHGWQVRAPGSGAGDRWAFPSRDPRRILGLQRWLPEASAGEWERWLRPTPPLRTRDGRRVLIGWLRFLHLLDDRDGRVLARARLPGLAVGLHLLPDGAAVDVARGRGGASERLRVQVEGDALRLTWDRSRLPPTPLELLPVGEEVAWDELRRVAWAELPLLDDQLAVWRGGDPRPELRALWVRPDPPGRRLPPLRRVGLWFDQGPRTPCLGTAISAVDPELQRLVRPGDVLREVVLPSGLDVDSDQVLVDPVELVLLRPGESGWVRVLYQPPAHPLRPAEWRRLLVRAEALAARDPDPNPWLVAAAGVAAPRVAEALSGRLPLGPGLGPLRRWLTARGRTRLEQAARSPHLSPREQVELACWLDRLGHEPAADLALREALRRLVEEHAYLPEWAGYGRLDPGVPLARRAEEAWFTGHLERARALRRWRDLFAPVLQEGPVARDALARAGPLEDALQDEVHPPGPPRVEASQGGPPAKGVAGLDAAALLQVDHAIRLQGTFVLLVAGLLLITFLRCRRHARRDLERMGHKTAGARLRLWVDRPLTRLRLSWPAYVTTQDKLAFVVLYAVYFATFGVQDAGFEALVALRSPPQAALAGMPAEPEALDALERACAGWEPLGEAGAAPITPGLVEADQALRGLPSGQRTPRGLARATGSSYAEAERALLALGEAGLARRGEPAPLEVLYARAWAKEAARLSAEERRLAWRDALARRREPRSLLGMAETLFSLDEREEAGRLVEEALAAEPGLAAARLLEARLQGAAPDPRLVAEASRGSRRLALLQALGSPPGAPLAPPPAVGARDLLLVGAARWTSRIPGRAARDLILPFPGQVDASLVAFNETWNLNLEFARLRNLFFWLVPCSLGVLVLWLLVAPQQWFEPLPHDVAPPLRVRLLAVLVPGVPQLMRGRPVRGVCLLVPAYYLGQTLWNGAFLGRRILGDLRELAHMAAPEQAALTAENASAIPLIELHHFEGLAQLLFCVFLLHWGDLWLQRRRGRRREGAGASGSGTVVIPLDSQSGPSIVRTAPPERSSPGPFDHSQ